jgi:hypothetical protein
MRFGGRRFSENRITFGQSNDLIINIVMMPNALLALLGMIS